MRSSFPVLYLTKYLFYFIHSCTTTTTKKNLDMLYNFGVQAHGSGMNWVGGGDKICRNAAVTFVSMRSFVLRLSTRKEHGPCRTTDGIPAGYTSLRAATHLGALRRDFFSGTTTPVGSSASGVVEWPTFRSLSNRSVHCKIDHFRNRRTTRIPWLTFRKPTPLSMLKKTKLVKKPKDKQSTKNWRCNILL